MYTFKSNIDTKEYDNYINNYSTASFMQDRRWAKVKNNFKNVLCGIYEDKKLIAATSVLIRNLGFGLKLMYIPRGPLMDFTNLELVKCFKEGIYKLAKEEGCYAVTIEPNFCNTELSLKEITSKQKVEIPINYSKNWEEKHNNLTKMGFIHQGFPKEIDKSYQPRFNMVISLSDKDNKVLTIDEVTKTFKSKYRYYLGAFHEKRGVYFERSNDPEKLKDFMRIISCTEERQNISLRSIDYFKTILDNFKDKAAFIYGYVDLEKYLTFLQENNGKEDEIKEIKEMLKKDKKLLLSASLTILPVNDKGIKMSDYIYAGNNLALPQLRISTAMVYEIMKLSIENDCCYCNLGGVDGSLNDHLSNFKSKFNPIVFEYIGEYDLIINKGKYLLAKKGIPLAKKIRRLARKK